MWRALAWLEDVATVLSLALFTIFIITSVVFRYLLNAPLSWTEEASLIAFAWLLFLGAAVCARDNAHILIDLISPAPHTRWARAMETFAALFGAVTALFVAWISYRYTLGAAPMVTPIFRVSSVVYNAAAPLGLALVSLHLLRHAVLAALGHDAVKRPDGAV